MERLPGRAAVRRPQLRFLNSPHGRTGGPRVAVFMNRASAIRPPLRESGSGVSTSDPLLSSVVTSVRGGWQANKEDGTLLGQSASYLLIHGTIEGWLCD